jgi:hypothetical protein
VPEGVTSSRSLITHALVWCSIAGSVDFAALGPATGGSVSFEVEAVAKSAAGRSLLPAVTVWLVAAM